MSERKTTGFAGGNLLAFNDPWHDSSFFFQDEQGVTHIESERFTRRKYECINPMVIFPELYPDRVEAFRTIAVQPNAELALFMHALLLAKHTADAPAPAIPFVDRWLARLNPSEGRADSPAVQKLLHHLLRKDVQIYLCGHHAAHAANAYFSSPFDEALVVTLDGGGRDFAPAANGRNVVGELEYLEHAHAASRRIYGTVYEARGNAIELRMQLQEFSIGEIWNRVLPHVLGLKHGEEGTAMAMATLGDPQRFRAEFLDPCVAWPEAEFLDPERLSHVNGWLAALKAQVVQEQDRHDVCAAMQACTEERVREFLAGHVGPDVRNLCLAGGVFLNCQLTGKLQEWFPWLQNVFVPPAPYDGGLPIGAAQMVHHEVRGRTERLAGSRWAPFGMGRQYDRQSVLDAASAAGATCVDAGDADFLARLEEGRIGALFQGSAESGRRALGHRSIVAHPGFPGLKQHLNESVKRRQWFRPFAPMALAEHVGEWFECPAGFASPYMSFAVRVRPQASERLANVLHLDGTARVQTVHAGLTPRLHQILALWHERTGLPVLLNTSFNENEPIVETPADAISTFMRTPIDCLYFADHRLLLTKT